jgi:hypothetical protein
MFISKEAIRSSKKPESFFGALAEIGGFFSALSIAALFLRVVHT